MLEIKDEGREFHISKARLVGCGFSLLVLPIFLAFVTLDQTNRGTAAATLTYVLLTTLYVKRRFIHNKAFTATTIAVFLIQLFIAMQPRIDTFEPVYIFLFIIFAGSIFMLLVARLAEVIFVRPSADR